MTRTTDELAAVARTHAAAEAVDDLATTLATLGDDPVYELLPMGVAFHGRPAARTYYEHFFGTVRPLVRHYELRNEWVNDRGLAQEYVIEFGLPEGVEHHPVLSILVFGDSALSGERVYASDRLLHLLFGPALELARPLR